MAFLKDKYVLAEFLKISPRTLNRYLQKYNIDTFVYNKTKKVDARELFQRLNNDDLGQVGTMLDSLGQFESQLVNKNDIIDLHEAIGTTRDRAGQSETEFDFSSLNKEEVLSEKFFEKDGKENVENFLSSMKADSKEVQIYKNLYAETLTELKIKQERLEGATYRVGQLEAQLKNTVPLLSYRQKEEEVIELHETQKSERKRLQIVFDKLKQEKADLKLVKNIYLILLFTCLFITPLLIIYFLNQ